VKSLAFLVLSLSLTLAASLLASGCTGKQERAEQRRESQTEEPRGTESTRPPADPPGVTATVDASATVNELFGRIHEHESTLSQTISAGRLNEVGREAFLIRDLAVAASGRATVPVNQKAALEAHMATVRRVATDLDEAGKAGDLNEAKARNAEFQQELGIIERMIREAGGTATP
jgi:hypothetical protein